MNKKLNILRYFYLVMLFLLCVFMGFVSATPSRATEALAHEKVAPLFNDQNSITRVDMMDIAERYMTYKWRAVNTHAWNGVEPEIKNDMHENYYAPGQGNNVDTPDIDWCINNGKNPWGCWKYADNINIGMCQGS